MNMFYALVIGALAAAWLVVKGFHQWTLDRSLVAYTLTFPAELDPEQVIEWFAYIAGELQSSDNHLGGYRTLVLEIYATAETKQYRFRAPWEQARDIAHQLQGHIPGMTAIEDPFKVSEPWTVASEWGESRPYLPLRITKPAGLSRTIINSLDNLEAGEEVCYQLVLTPSREKQRQGEYQKPKYDGHIAQMVLSRFDKSKEATETHREKLREHNFDAAIRIAVRAATQPRAASIHGHVSAALRSVKGYKVEKQNNYLRKRNPLYSHMVDFNRRVGRATGNLFWPAKFTASELVALIGWPLGDTNLPGVPRCRSRYLAAPDSVPRDGMVVAVSNHPSKKRPIALTQGKRQEHLHIIGATGSGKTGLLTNMVTYDMQQGHGVVVIDPKGDLFNAALDRVPANRMRDTIVFDLSDKDYPVGFNILSDGTPDEAVSEVTRLFKAIYPDLNRGVWARTGLLRGLTTLAGHAGATFPDIVPLLSPGWANEAEEKWRKEVMEGVEDESIRTFWKRHTDKADAVQDTIAAPVIDRAAEFNERAVLRNILGQSRSSFDMRDVALGKKILLVNLSGQVDYEAARLLGMMLINSFWRAARNRTDRTNFTSVVIDEAQDFMSSPTGLEEMATKARSTNVGLTIAHQDLGQVRKRAPELLSTFMSNLRNKIVFNLSADDASDFAKELGDPLLKYDLVYQQQFEMVIRLMTERGIAGPMTGRSIDPRHGAPALGVAGEVRRISRELYAKARQAVEEEIKARRQNAKPNRKPPRLAPESWT